MNLSADSKVPVVEKKMPYTKGLNLTQWLEPFGAGNSSSTRYGKTDFENIKSLGVEIVRVPVHFENWSSGAPDYVIEDWLWKILDNAVEWCTELKMYIIIDFHNDCNGNSRTKPDVEKMLMKVWPQIAERYKNSGEYVIYEIMNEPHMKSGNLNADVDKWGKIQGRVLKTIRSIDSKHTVIVGAEDWNSVHQLLKLPDYEDDNLIYNFHDYSPFLFSHQGAGWTHLKRLTKIPFPYVKSKMPSLPKDANDAERNEYNNYEKNSSEKVLVEPLNKAVDFANKRHVALMCNEYGVMMDYADNQERTNWYRMKANWMEERNIIRVSWDYNGSFGIFNRADGEFPEDVNTVLVEGMGFKAPSKKNAGNKPNWYDSAVKRGSFEIYKDGFAENVIVGGWVNTQGKKLSFSNKDSDGGPMYIGIPKADAYNTVEFDFKKPCNLTKLIENDMSLELEIKTLQKDLRLNVYFRNPDKPEKGDSGYPWRCGEFIRSKQVPSDGMWHKIKIPLKSLQDYGAWSNAENKWISSKKMFDWKQVRYLVLDFAEIPVTKDIMIRNIEIK